MEYGENGAYWPQFCDVAGGEGETPGCRNGLMSLCWGWGCVYAHPFFVCALPQSLWCIVAIDLCIAAMDFVHCRNEF
jgi:hypothetical protein